MPSSLLGLLWSSTQFALIRQSITIRSVCHTSMQQADVAPSKKPPSLNWGRHTLARALWLSRRCQRSRSSVFPLFVDKGVAPSRFTDMSFHEKLQRKRSAEMFPACLCHRLSLCVQHNNNQVLCEVTHFSARWSWIWFFFCGKRLSCAVLVESGVQWPTP